jgi:hypothetical protein
MGTGQLNALRTAFERMTDLNTVAAALSEPQTFYTKTGSFSSPLAHKMTVDGKTSLICIFFNFISLQPMY